MLVFQFFAITFIKVWVFHYKHMGTMCKRSNYTQNSPQYEGDCEYRITSVENMMCYPGMEDDLDLFQAFCLQSGFPQKFTADATQSLSITFRWEVCL